MRSCQICGIYHATKKSLTAHVKECKKHLQQTTNALQPTLVESILPRIRPKRTAAKRQREQMVVWTSRLNDEHVDWFDEEEVEETEDINHSKTGESVLPVLDMDYVMSSEWEDDE